MKGTVEWPKKRKKNLGAFFQKGGPLPENTTEKTRQDKSDPGGEKKEPKLSIQFVYCLFGLTRG